MDRRQALFRLAAVGSVPLAGCSSILDTGGGGTVLGSILVVNTSYDSNRIDLSVERGGESLLARTISLPSIRATEGTSAVLVEPSWPEVRGRYTVRAHHVGTDGERESDVWSHTFTREDYRRYYGDRREDPGCVGAVVTIGSLSEGSTAPIGVGPTYVEDPCATSK